MAPNKQISLDLSYRRQTEIRTVNGDEFDLRKFDPSSYGFRPDAGPGDVLVSNPDCCPLLHINSKKCKYFMFALYADGACLANGTAAARASVGVYGTPDAWYNAGYLLPPNLPQSNQSAEIYSAIAAIKVARAILKEHRPDLGKCGCKSIVVLLMDSSYVVRAMTDWVRKWQANGFRNARGMPVVNAEAFKRLDYDIRQVLKDRNIIVHFWHVPRMYNSGADKMAAQAFQRNRFLDLSAADPHLDADSDHLEVCEAFSGMGFVDVS